MKQIQMAHDQREDSDLSPPDYESASTFNHLASVFPPPPLPSFHFLLITEEGGQGGEL